MGIWGFPNIFRHAEDVRGWANFCQGLSLAWRESSSWSKRCLAGKPTAKFNGKDHDHIYFELQPNIITLEHLLTSLDQFNVVNFNNTTHFLRFLAPLAPKKVKHHRDGVGFRSHDWCHEEARDRGTCPGPSWCNQLLFPPQQLWIWSIGWSRLEQVEAKPTIVVNLFLNGKAWQSNIRGPYFRLWTWKLDRKRWVSGACWANVAFRIVLFSQVASSESSGKIQVLQMEPTNSHQFAQSLHKLVAKWSFLLRRWLGWVWVSTLRYAPWTKKLWASHGACHVWWPGKAAKILTNGNQNKHTWE